MDEETNDRREALRLDRASQNIATVGPAARPSDVPPGADPAPIKRRKLLQILGPGLITGAADDDPSGIATYSQAGAQFGYGLSWTLLLSWPLMSVVQEISARIGRVSGKGIAGVIKQAYPPSILYGLVGLLLIANIINIGADLGAMAAALGLLIGGPQLLFVVLFATVSVLLEVFVSYARYVSILKWLTLSLFAYVGTAFVVHVPWGTVLHDLVLPKFELTSDYWTVVVAVLGTTISPYLFFWQAGQEVEEIRERPGAKPLVRAPDQAEPEFERIRIDTYLGMLFSDLVGLFIVITTAATLHAHGVTEIETSAQAAEALRPIAGPLVFLIFALGIIGTGMLALPVLAGSAAHAVGETFGWHVGLGRKPERAKAFYLTIAAATLIGAVLNFVALDPIKALFWSAVINGVVAVPVMAMMMHLASRRLAMGRFTLPSALKIGGWLATLVMAAAAIGMFVAMLA
jgi:NRAMP (natural resistance-associated macrophage protein)-like metal ion transporter